MIHVRSTRVNVYNALIARSLQNQPSLADLAFDALVEEIFSGQLEPGAPVGIEEVATRLGISTTPVREALVRAASQRLLHGERNKGYRVARLLSAGEYAMLFHLRRLLESDAAERSTLDEAAIAALVDAVERMSAVTDDRDEADLIAFSRADCDFHTVLVSAAGDPFLLDAWTGLHSFMQAHLLLARGPKRAWSGSAASHDAIVDAARRGDRRALKKAIAEHIDAAADELVKLRSTFDVD